MQKVTYPSAPDLEEHARVGNLYTKSARIVYARNYIDGVASEVENREVGNYTISKK